MQYCSLQHQTLLLSPVTSTAGYCFCLVPPFILSGVISPLISRHLLTWGVPLSVSYHFAFSYCSWGPQGKNTEVVCHSLLQWTAFCQTSAPWPAHLELPHTAWLSFIELDIAVVRVIRLTSFLWVWFVCLPSDASGNTYRLTWVSLIWTWGISSPLLQQSAATAPYLGRGVSPHHCPSWPWTWRSSSWPSCTRAATAPWTWGCSSQLLPLTLGVG